MSEVEQPQLIYVIDDDEAVRDSMGMLLESADLPYRCYASADSFLDEHDGSQRGCLVLDIRMPGMTGLELQQRLAGIGSSLPVIFITGHGDVPMAVEAMRQGALDFLRKPVNESRFSRSYRLCAGPRIGQLASKDRPRANPRAHRILNRTRAGSLSTGGRRHGQQGHCQ